MGAETSIMDNCHLGTCHPSTADIGYSVQPGETGEGQRITVFLQKRKKQAQADAVKKYAKNLKTIRHPYILRYVASGSTAGVPFLATDECLPLAVALPLIHRREIIAGISDVTRALAFLHDKLSSCHNNVCVSSVYTGKDGSWKLGNFDHMCKFSTMTSAIMDKCRECQRDVCVPPEELVEGYEPNPEQLYSRDVYGLGVLVQELLGDIKDDEHIERIVTYARDHLKHPNPTGRPQCSDVLSTDLLRNDFLDIVEFLSSLVTKGAEEKETFFVGLLPRLQHLPQELIARRLTHSLLSRFTIHDPTAIESVVPSLLTPQSDSMDPADDVSHVTPLLPDDLFTQYVVPELLKIFTVRSLHIRLYLLLHFPRYLRLLTNDDIIDHIFPQFTHLTVHITELPSISTSVAIIDRIFPQLLLGLRDTSDNLVIASLRTLALLIPRVGADVIIGGARFPFFKAGQPKFMKQSTPLPLGHIRNDSSDITSVYSNDSKDDSQLTPEKRLQVDRPVPTRQTSRQHSLPGNPTKPKGDNPGPVTSAVQVNNDDSPPSNIKKYGALEDAHGNNALWDMVRHTNLDIPIKDIDIDSDVSSLSNFVETNNVVVYNDDILEESDNKKSHRLKIHTRDKKKHSRESSDLNLSDIDDLNLQSNEEWLNDDRWSPLHSPTEKTNPNSHDFSHSKMTVEVNKNGSNNNTEHISSNKTRHSPGEKTNRELQKSHDKSNTISSTAKTIANGSVMQLKHSKHNKIPKNTKSSGLGEEFDVKSIIIPQSPKQDDDFFAGMMPALTSVTQKVGVDTGSSPNVVQGKSDLFKVADTQESSGWGDEDLDWGTDF